MPYAPKRFRHPAQQTKTERERAYNTARHRTDPQYGLYNSKRWRDLRDMHRFMFPWCELCDRLFGRRVPMVFCNHIDPAHRERDFWDPENLESLCRACHGIVSGCEKNGRVPFAGQVDRRGRIIAPGHPFHDTRAEIYARSAKLSREAPARR